MAQYSTKEVAPVLSEIVVPEHVVTRFMDRYMQDGDYVSGFNEVREQIKQVVMSGRRSDRDASLLSELEPWTTRVKWIHQGRPVAVFMGDARLCCLVCRDKIRHDMLIVLTCFQAIGNGTWNTSEEVRL